MVVDVGPASDEFDAGRRLVVPELKRLGVRKIDLLVLTHDDQDHIGGLGAVMEAFSVGRLVVGASVRSGIRDSLGSVPVEQLDGALIATVGEGKVRLVSGPGGSDNDSSVFCSIDVLGHVIVSSGDGSAEYERNMLHVLTGPVEVMKANHHGSDDSNSTIWLKQIYPRYVVIPVGRTNTYGHPGEETLGRLDGVGARVLRTDRDGSVRFDFRGGRWELAD